MMLRREWDIHLRKSRKVRQGEEVLVVLPGIWEVSLLFYVATIFDELREDSSALPTII